MSRSTPGTMIAGLAVGLTAGAAIAAIAPAPYKPIAAVAACAIVGNAVAFPSRK